MNKIKILLIDDNPQSLMKDPANLFLPSLTFGFSDENFSEARVETNFELGWLQSPRDVVEFRSLTEDLIQKHGHDKLIGEGFVPEIVLFDYKLSEGLSRFIDHDLEEYKSLIPTYNLSRKLGKRAHRFPDWDSINTELTTTAEAFGAKHPKLTKVQCVDLAKVKIKRDLNKPERNEEPLIFSNQKDDMGCYAGGLIAFQFRDHPCVGVPITSKEGITEVSQDALFFEWLLSEDFDNQFGRKYGKRPFWNEILPEAVRLLRNRIELLVKQGKITPSYYQLSQLSKGSEQVDGIFSFTSTYGERHLPLDGLFIDGKESAEEWAIRLIKLLPKSNADIAKALETSELLWRAFIRDFGKRIDLSNLAYWEQDPDRKLTKDEQTEFATLKRDFEVKNGVIEGQTTSIKGFFPRAKNNVNFTVRLTVLHLAARAEIEMNKCRKNASNKSLYRELDPYEKFNLLFPIVSLKDDVILPMHKDVDKDDLIEQGRTWAFRKLGTTAGDWLNFEKWITPGEKSLLRAIYFAQDEYYPDWLKQ